MTTPGGVNLWTYFVSTDWQSIAIVNTSSLIDGSTLPGQTPYKLLSGQLTTHLTIIMNTRY